MKLLLLGSTGQVGRAWVELSQSPDWPKGFTLIPWSRSEGDLSNPEALLNQVMNLHAEQKLGGIINAGAYTQVDQAETDRRLCRMINALSPANLAEFCAEQKLIYVHYSSDYVYSGEGKTPHHEEEDHSPINYYGLTKAEGDEAIENSGARFLNFRTSWVYSHSGKNFVLSMLKLAREREELKIVNDQVGAPTYAPDLARASLMVLKKALVEETLTEEFPSGVYHLCNGGETSWFGFAEEIFRQVRQQGMKLAVQSVMPIPSTDYPTPAKRPLNSRLSMEKVEALFQVQMRNWKDALAECLQKVKG